jgi:antitoxin (DNA-binding transcriptional repressor) of toxin-antitoxin stability system
VKRIVAASELADRLNEILSEVESLHESYVVERNGTPIARFVPFETTERAVTLAEALSTWCEISDPSFANDLAKVCAADRPPANPWES